MKRKMAAALSVLVLSIVVNGYTCAFQQEKADERSLSVLQAVAPKYPPIAIAARVSGDVIVEVKVNRKGLVSDTKIISGHKLLRQAAEKAATRWVFPSIQSGEDRNALKLVFQFTILSEKNSYEDEWPVFKPPFQVEVKSISRVIIDKSSDPPGQEKKSLNE